MCITRVGGIDTDLNLAPSRLRLIPCCNRVKFARAGAEAGKLDDKVETMLVGDTESLLVFFAGRADSSSTDIRGFNGFGLEMFNSPTSLVPDFGLTDFPRLLLFVDFVFSFLVSSTPTVLFSFSMILSKLTSRDCGSLVERLRFLDGMPRVSLTGLAPTDQPVTSNTDILLPKEHKRGGSSQTGC
jgi:hypothetical protein